MPNIFDNIDNHLSDQLNLQLDGATRLDACVGYFNLRGWNTIAEKVDQLAGAIVEENGEHVTRYCRVLIGMTKTPMETLMEAYMPEDDRIMDNQKASAMKTKLALELKEQLTIGVPTISDEIALKKLRNQLQSGQVVVKLFLRHQLHAKLYLTHHATHLTP
jgi:hypothetical protein